MPACLSEGAGDPAVIASARGVRSAVQAASDQIESERRLPADLLDQLHQARLFRLLLPRSVGGLETLIARTHANAAAVEAWVGRTAWIDYLAVDPATRSTTSVCLRIVDPRVTAMNDEARQALVLRMKALVEGEGAAFDIEAHRNAPAGLRIWCGCTVETADIEALTPWLDWAFETALAE